MGTETAPLLPPPPPRPPRRRAAAIAAAAALLVVSLCQSAGWNGAAEPRGSSRGRSSSRAQAPTTERAGEGDGEQNSIQTGAGAAWGWALRCGGLCADASPAELATAAGVALGCFAAGCCCAAAWVRRGPAPVDGDTGELEDEVDRLLAENTELRAAAEARAAAQQSHAAAQQVCVGASVTVLTDFLSDSATRCALREGMRGSVLSVDDDGDVDVWFEGLPKTQWVFKENMGNLRFDAEVAPVQVGLRVEAEQGVYYISPERERGGGAGQQAEEEAQAVAIGRPAHRLGGRRVPLPAQLHGGGWQAPPLRGPPSPAFPRRNSASSQGRESRPGGRAARAPSTSPARGPYPAPPATVSEVREVREGSSASRPRPAPLQRQPTPTGRDSRAIPAAAARLGW